MYPYSLAILPLHSRLAPQFIGCIVSAAVLHPMGRVVICRREGDREEIGYAGDGTPCFVVLGTFFVSRTRKSSWGSKQNATC